MVYNPLGGGLLTGKHSFDAKPTEGRYGDSKLAAMYRKRYWDKQLFDAIGDLSRIASDVGVTLAELSLRWLAYRDGVGSMLLGGSKPEQLRANIAAVANGPLPTDVVESCDAIGASLRSPCLLTTADAFSTTFKQTKTTDRKTLMTSELALEFAHKIRAREQAVGYWWCWTRP